MTLTTPPEAAGERLDRHLSAVLGRARNQVQRWIEAGLVSVDGRPARASLALRAGARVEVEIPPPPADGLVPEDEEIAVVWADEHLLALDKPAGLAVHPGAGRSTGTLVHRLLARYPEVAGVGGPGRPGIVHRLDIGTTGLLLVARSPAAYSRLSHAFAERRVTKSYLGIAWGRPREDHTVVEAPIGRHPVERRKMAVVVGGRPARTEVERLATVGGLSLLRLAIATGRTHQIRVHLREIGLPLVGDPVYGEARWRGWPAGPARAAVQEALHPALHAWRLRLAHPITGEPLALEAPPPAGFRELWARGTGSPWPPLPPE